MKRILQCTFICQMFVMLFFTTASFGQSAGFNTTFLVLQTNNGSSTYYDLQASTSNPDFNGANLGTFCEGSTSGLIFNGAEHNVFKCGGCDLQSTRVYYRIYPLNVPSGSFVSNNVGYSSGFANGCGGEDQKWSNTGYNTNLLSGLTAGTYTLEVYSDATITCQTGTAFASNGGLNYKASFTVNANVTYYADTDLDGFGDPEVSQVSCTGAPAGYVTDSSDCNDEMWYYVDDDGDGFGSTTFSPCQGVLNNTDCDDTLLQYVDADGDGFGSTTFADCGVDNNDDCNDNLLRYVDEDSDGFGSDTFSACSGVTNTDDCDDNDVQYEDLDGDGYGSEVLAGCGVQNNNDCDDTQILYVDDDGDGFGTTTQAACGVSNDDDCDDTLLQYEDLDGDGFGSTILAGCGASDNDDCNDNQLQYEDEDGDGFGSMTMVECGVANNTDCDDDDADLRGLFSFYADGDDDGYGTGELIDNICAFSAAVAPDGYSVNNTDCNDGNAAISPGDDEEYYNGIDDNCDGNLDEGNQITTQIIASQCGNTLETINTLVSAISRPNSTMYRFEVTNTMTNEVQILERPLQWFALSMLSSYDYATTYSIRVEIQRNGIWLGYYGPTCNVSTPDVIAPGGDAQVSPAQCGITLPTISTLISTTSIQNVTGYRFRVINMTDGSAPNQVQEIDRNLQWFALTMLPTFNYGTTYMIQVAVKTTDDYSDFGSPCMVSTPAVPSLVNCGGTVASSGSIVATTNMSRTTMYRFEITNLSNDDVTILDRPLHWFRFNMLDEYSPSTAYSVRVALMTSGSWSMFGNPCTITSPGAARPGEIKGASDEFAAVAYPNPFAQSFSLNVSTSANASVSVKVYDMTGRILESSNVEAADLESLQIGETYPAGVYNVIVSEGENVKALRVVKR